MRGVRILPGGTGRWRPPVRDIARCRTHFLQAARFRRSAPFAGAVRAGGRTPPGWNAYFAYGDASLDPVFMFRIGSGSSFCMRSCCGKWVHSRRDLEGCVAGRNVQADDRLHFKGLFELGFLERMVSGGTWWKNPPNALEESKYRDQLERERVWNRLVYSSYRDLCAYLSAVTSLDIRMGGSTNMNFRKNSGDS